MPRAFFAPAPVCASGRTQPASRRRRQHCAGSRARSRPAPCRACAPARSTPPPAPSIPGRRHQVEHGMADPAAGRAARPFQLAGKVDHSTEAVGFGDGRKAAEEDAVGDRHLRLKLARPYRCIDPGAKPVRQKQNAAGQRRGAIGRFLKNARAGPGIGEGDDGQRQRRPQQDQRDRRDERAGSGGGQRKGCAKAIEPRQPPRLGVGGQPETGEGQVALGGNSHSAKRPSSAPVGMSMK